MDVKLEDCSDRISSLNTLLWIARKFNRKLRSIKKLLSGCDNYLAGLNELQNFLGDIQQDLDQSLPSSAYANSLDKRMGDLREKELQFIKENILKLQKDLNDAKPEMKAETLEMVVDKLTDHLSRIKYLCVEVRC